MPSWQEEGALARSVLYLLLFSSYFMLISCFLCNFSSLFVKQYTFQDILIWYNCFVNDALCYSIWSLINNRDCLVIIIWAATRENRFFAYAKTKTQISFAVTGKLISVFVFATQIVQFLCFLNPKFQVSSHLQWLYSRFVWDLVGNPEDRFSDVAAHIIYHYVIFLVYGV